VKSVKKVKKVNRELGIVKKDKIIKIKGKKK